MLLSNKQKRDLLNKAFDNGWFQIIVQVKGLFLKKMRAQVFLYSGEHYFILLKSSTSRLKDINIENLLNKGQVAIFTLEMMKNIKPMKILGIKGFRFIVDNKKYKFISHRNADSWVFHLQHPDKPVDFKL